MTAPEWVFLAAAGITFSSVVAAYVIARYAQRSSSSWSASASAPADGNGRPALWGWCLDGRWRRVEVLSTHPDGKRLVVRAFNADGSQAGLGTPLPTELVASTSEPTAKDLEAFRELPGSVIRNDNGAPERPNPRWFPRGRNHRRKE